uniref:neuroblastoma breakpoint family member 10 n=1 Tax=Panthera onca TaxID=9690 RepID=UPI0029555720|nr:neuroblastoma breakpoint family member 10 [Panthera onca]
MAAGIGRTPLPGGPRSGTEPKGWRRKSAHPTSALGPLVLEADALRSVRFPRKHDTLIQAHARELTHLRQKIQEGKGVCYLFIQHTKSIVKSFEGLLRSADIPYYQGQRFCEQLAQGSQLAESLASKLITENHNDKKDEDRQEPLAPRLSRGLQEEEVNEALEASLDEQYLTHSSRHDSHQLPRSSSFLLDMQEASSPVEVTRFSIFYLIPCPGGMAAEDEIQNLHQHLREILFINACLQEKLEHHLSISDQGDGYTSDFYRENLDSLAQLYNENRDIRKESLSLLAHLNRISRVSSSWKKMSRIWVKSKSE